MSWWTERHRTWRAALIQELGGVCSRADGTCDGGLELDHIAGRDYDVAKLSSHMRVKKYVEEAAAGALQVLCRRHNAQKGATLEQGWRSKARPDREAIPAWVTED